MNLPESPFLTQAETAPLFHYSLDHFRWLVRNRRAPVKPIKIGNRWMFKREDVIRALNLESK